jgi:O-antigen/teichoic acid export membrane protein
MALVNLALNFLLIPPFHAMGAAVATVLSYALILGISFVVSQRIYHVHYEYARVGIVLGLGTVTYLASAFLHLQLLPSIAANLGLIAMFVIATARLLHDAEWAVIRKLTLSLAQGLRDRLGA